MEAEINARPDKSAKSPTMRFEPILVQSVYNPAEGVVKVVIEEQANSTSKLSSEKKKGETKFNDGIRSVDFVLVWDESYLSSNEHGSVEKRNTFEHKLEEEGLELEHEPAEPGNGLHFCKIHAPDEVLRRYGEILKLRMPMKEVEAIPHTHSRGVVAVKNSWEKLKEKFVYADKKIFPDKSHRFTAIYSRDKEYLFNVASSNFFTPAVRSRIVQFIMDRTFFAEPKPHDIFVFGIQRLLDMMVYSAAYPLHDGDVKAKGTMRHTLLTEWASLRKWHRYQPVDYIKEYFGVKIGLYFAWLGFYTHMLVPASLIGLACFIYSICTLKDNKPSNDICSGKMDVKMCPHCDKFCDYWDLRDTCLHAKVTYLFDNYTTVFFAIFMSFWAALFLELWKRYSAEMTHRWDLTGWDTQEEQPRPQYLARLERLKSRSKPYINVITGAVERKVPFWTIRFPATILSFSIVILLVVLALAAVLGVVLYRMSVLAALSVYGADSVISSHAILFTTATAATINLTCIVIFNWMYTWLAEYLTELEMLRTQTEFDDSLTLKMYLLQFVNYYASIFYIAFCKGKLVGYPGKYYRLFGYRQEECGPGGCLLELCIQLCIIMVGKQAVNTLLEMLLPLLYKWWNSRKLARQGPKGVSLPQWKKDYKLVEWGHQALFPEYLEMVLQYGFVTIFVSAFPLAPLFALINNILEMRLDATKLLLYHRRPVAQRVRNIGVWFRILDSISKLAVVTNGFIIAFSSDFIPRIVYIFGVSENHSLEGFMNHSLAIMDTRDLDLVHPPNTSVPFCRYPDYRAPPWSPNKYDKTHMYWTVLTARLIFVLIFEKQFMFPSSLYFPAIIIVVVTFFISTVEYLKNYFSIMAVYFDLDPNSESNLEENLNVVVLVVLFVQWCIPDIPAKLKEQMRREAFITNEIIIHQEAERSRESRTPKVTPDFFDWDFPKSEKRKTEDTSGTSSKFPSSPPMSMRINPLTIDFTKKPKDEALVHVPLYYGDISEVTV